MQPVVTVGLDGSTESLAAARWAADEADKRRLTLRLLHAWPMLLPEPAHAASEVDQERRLLVVGRRAPPAQWDTPSRTGCPRRHPPRALPRRRLPT
ncbi:universal stress protein [Streptomyces sp. B21-079]